MSPEQSYTPGYATGSSRRVWLVALIVAPVVVVAWLTSGESTMTNRATIPVLKTELAVLPRSYYRNGLHLASGAYVSPAGQEEVFVALDLEDGIILSAAFKGMATHPTSRFMQEKFNEGFLEQVVGKPIDELSLTVVNGSSLTPKGFMEAVRKIQAEAQA